MHFGDLVVAAPNNFYANSENVANFKKEGGKALGTRNTQDSFHDVETKGSLAAVILARNSCSRDSMLAPLISGNFLAGVWPLEAATL